VEKPLLVGSNIIIILTHVSKAYDCKQLFVVSSMMNVRIVVRLQTIIISCHCDC